MSEPEKTLREILDTVDVGLYEAVLAWCEREREKVREQARDAQCIGCRLQYASGGTSTHIRPSGVYVECMAKEIRAMKLEALK